MKNFSNHIKWFRDSSPYINAHRNRTFVVYLGGDAIAAGNLANIINDLTLLNSLGVRLVLVHGAAPQINQRLLNDETRWQTIAGKRITTPEMIAAVVEVIGGVRSNIEARLSMGLVNSPMHGSELVVSSGNFVRAKPMGIVDGVDFHHTGETRSVNTTAINNLLDCGNIVLISPIGYSPAGETFNMESKVLATDVAVKLGADKLIFFYEQAGLMSEAGELINEIQIGSGQQDAFSEPDQLLLTLCSRACAHDIGRCHIVSHHEDGAILQELFTRDGSGTQITRVSYEQLRRATSDDVAGIISLIEPLEEQEILVKRPRELIESEIDQFVVIERDGMIIASAALYPFESMGELACLATHPDYQKRNCGGRLLTAIEKQARNLNLTSIFVLTTRATHWFIERGFIETDLSELPEDKRQFYNTQRNSKCFVKTL